MHQDQIEVDEYSKIVIAELFACHPQWRNFTRIEKEEGKEKGYFYIEIPAPPGSDLAKPLYILTNNEEITVGLDYYHVHYNYMVGPPEASDADKALLFIEDILVENVSVVSWWDGDSWKGSAPIKYGNEPDASGFVSPYKKIRVRSWKGNYDRNINS